MSADYRTDCAGCREKGDDIARANAQIEELRRSYRRDMWSRALYILVVGGIVGAVVSLCVVMVGSSWAEAKAKALAPPPPCADAAEIIVVNSSQRTCHPAASINVEVLPGGEARALVRCECPRGAVSQ